MSRGAGEDELKRLSEEVRGKRESNKKRRSGRGEERKREKRY